MTARSSKVEFDGSQGHRLAARLDLPSGAPQAFAVFAHCFTCSKDVFAASRIAGRLSELGIATLRFDFTGLGSSDGEFANTDFSSNIEDLVKAADWLREAHQAPSILIGHSLGGTAVLAAAVGEIPEAVAVATTGAPSDAAHVVENFADHLDEIERTGQATVELPMARVHAKDCAECGEGREGRIDRFERTISIEGPLSADLDDKLVEIAGKCPVHRTLEASSAVITKISRGT